MGPWASLSFAAGLNVRSVLCQIDEEKEAKKRERARLLLAGHSMAEDDDPFEGLTPQVQHLACTAPPLRDSVGYRLADAS